MYVRFVTPLIHPDSRVESGFFRASWYLDRIGCPSWIRSELDQQFAWFNDNLAKPDRVARPYGRGVLHGVCWFRSAARECISRGHYCAWLIGEAGLPVEAITMRNPREFIWQDDQQIVTPARIVPRAFRGWPLCATEWD